MDTNWKSMIEETIESRKMYEGKIVNVRLDRVRLPDGGESYREVVEHGGAVAMVPIDDEGNVYFVHQFRKPVDKVLLEIPAGRLEPGEDPEDCARRELAEEIGFWPGELQELSIFYSSPGFSNEKLYLYLTTNLEKKVLANDTDEAEFVSVEKMPLSQALEKVANGEIEDGKTAIGLVLTSFFLQQ